MAAVYIATFYAHIGAVRFNKLERLLGNESKMMPVPRMLSSSCGTCVRYSADEPVPKGALMDEIEQIVTECIDNDGNISYSGINIDI